jgi:hypothetical protein
MAGRDPVDETAMVNPNRVLSQAPKRSGSHGH